MQSSEFGKRFDIVGGQQQRDDELGVRLRFATAVDIGSAQRLVRSRVVRRGRHGALQQPDRPFVIQVQLREPGEGTIQLALSDQQNEPIGHSEQIQICVIGTLEFFRHCRQPPAQCPTAWRLVSRKVFGNGFAEDILGIRGATGFFERACQRELGALIAWIQAHSIAQVLDAPGDVPINRVGGREDSVCLG
jgi:hypothetical protein